MSSPDRMLDVFRAMNKLKQRRLVRDLALIGSVAASLYIGPINTVDVDIMVLVNTDEEWIKATRAFAELTNARWDSLFQDVDGIFVQILPASMSPLYEDAVESARVHRADNIRVRAASPEHLILMALVAFRPDKDLLRIPLLLEHADAGRLQSLMERFDDAQSTLASRLARFTQSSDRR